MDKGLIVSVNYGSSKETVSYVNSLVKTVGFENTDMFIIDNASEKKIYTAIDNFLTETGKNNINLIGIEKNLGYFGAVKFAFDNYIKEWNKYKFIIISNNDIIIKDSKFFQKISEVIDKYDVIAPRIIAVNSGKEQNPHRVTEVSGIQKFQYTLLYTNYFIGKSLYFLRNIFKKISGNKKINLTERNIFSSHGSFFIFSSSFFQKGGYIDDGFFLYGEEDSVAAQCRQFGCSIGFVPGIVVYHNEHQTTKASGFRKNIYEIQKKAYRYIKNKYPDFY